MNNSINKVIYGICIIICVTVGVLVIDSYRNVTALEVKEVPTSTLKVTNSPSQVNTGKTILQPTFNPQR